MSRARGRGEVPVCGMPAWLGRLSSHCSRPRCGDSKQCVLSPRPTRAREWRSLVCVLLAAVIAIGTSGCSGGNAHTQTDPDGSYGDIHTRGSFEDVSEDLPSGAGTQSIASWLYSTHGSEQD